MVLVSGVMLMDVFGSRETISSSEARDFDNNPGKMQGPTSHAIAECIDYQFAAL